MESEIVMDDCPDPPLAPTPDREAMAESHPDRAAEPIFEGELLLEDNRQRTLRRWESSRIR